MAKLSDKATEAAWDDFKKHLIDLGILVEDSVIRSDNEKMQLAKMAFKQGYVAGANAPKISVSKSKKRKIEGRVARSVDQRKEDGKKVEGFLEGCKEPMTVSEIITAMNIIGLDHWNTNNASSFLKTAMKDGFRIKKEGYGVYSFDEGGIQ